MTINGAELQPLYDSIVDVHSKLTHDCGKVNGLVKSFNRLVKMGQANDKKNYFSDVQPIEPIEDYEPSKIELNKWYETVSEKLSEMEFGISIVYGRMYEKSITRNAKGNQILVNQHQEAHQKQEVNIISINSFEQALKVIDQSQIRNEAKEQAKQQLKDFESELKKEKPDKGKVRKVLDWANDFQTITGIQVIPFIAGLIAGNWDKIVH